MAETITGYVRYADADRIIRVRADDSCESRIVFEGCLDARAFRDAVTAMADRLPITLTQGPTGRWKVGA